MFEKIRERGVGTVHTQRPSQNSRSRGKHRKTARTRARPLGSFRKETVFAVHTGSGETLDKEGM